MLEILSVPSFFSIHRFQLYFSVVMISVYPLQYVAAKICKLSLPSIASVNAHVRRRRIAVARLYHVAFFTGMHVSGISSISDVIPCRFVVQVVVLNSLTVMAFEERMAWSDGQDLVLGKPWQLGNARRLHLGKNVKKEKLSDLETVSSYGEDIVRHWIWICAP